MTEMFLERIALIVLIVKVLTFLHNVACYLDLYRLSSQIGKLKSHKLVVFRNDAQAVYLNRSQYKTAKQSMYSVTHAMFTLSL